MIERTFYMVAEIQRDSEGRVLPKRYVSGPYGEIVLAKQVSRELGDNYHVFQAIDFEDDREVQR